MVGYETVKIRMFGMDPATKAVHYLVLARKPDSIWQDAQYAMWDYIDWSHSDDKGREGVLSYGDYQIPNDRAELQFQKRFRDMYWDHAWADPYTGRRIR